MSATWPPFCQSIVAASVSRFQRNDGEKPITKSGLKSPATVSATRAMEPGFVTKTPIGGGLLFASSGTFPQIHVVRPPGLMKFRPKAAPNDPGAGKRGTVGGRFWMSFVFFANVARMLKSM